MAIIIISSNKIWTKIKRKWKRESIKKIEFGPNRKKNRKEGKI